LTEVFYPNILAQHGTNSAVSSGRGITYVQLIWNLLFSPLVQVQLLKVSPFCSQICPNLAPYSMLIISKGHTRRNSKSFLKSLGQNFKRQKSDVRKPEDS
jgi:hypothetical protein